MGRLSASVPRAAALYKFNKTTRWQLKIALNTLNISLTPVPGQLLGRSGSYPHMWANRNAVSVLVHVK